MAVSNFLINVSILYRNTQKYLDRELSRFDIGSGQVLFLFFINENEGITMQEATRILEVDKGTTTKSIQKLIEQDYVETRVDEKDKRVKRLYTTPKAAEVMNALYECRNQLRTLLASDMDFQGFEILLDRACDNARTYLQNLDENEEPAKIRIGGIQKMSLLDYPEKVACTVFTSGCGFKCPFCHNRELVFVPENYEYCEPRQVLSYLEKRKGLLDGVCISGGEPLLQEGLAEFIREIRRMGYLIKLDTNGNHPGRLKEILEEGLADYVAMDVKNTRAKYPVTVGLNESVFRIGNIEESMNILKASGVGYEFRTTVVKELHERSDLLEMAEWLRDAPVWYLQQYQDSENVIQRGFSAYSAKEMEELCEEIRNIMPRVKLRGTDK